MIESKTCNQIKFEIIDIEYKDKIKKCRDKIKIRFKFGDYVCSYATGSNEPLLEVKNYIQRAVGLYLYNLLEIDRIIDEAIEIKNLENNPKNFFLRLKCNSNNGGFGDADARKRFAACIALVVSMTDNKDDMPYMPQPGDTYRWSIDKSGNDFWISFDRSDNLNFTLSCRYNRESEVLAALATYIALRFNCELIGAV